MAEIKKEDGIGLSLEKSNWEKTWSCLPQNEVYSPEDVKKLSYSQDVGHPGEYPFTRGIYPSMYRKRLWTRREVSGHTSPLLSNERLRYLLDHGETGLNIIVDLPSAVGIDSDHPAFGITEVDSIHNVSVCTGTIMTTLT